MSCTITWFNIHIGHDSSLIADTNGVFRQGFQTKEQQSEAKSKENAWDKTIQDGVEALDA